MKEKDVIEEIWRILNETARRQEETTRRQEETARRQEETTRRQEEIDKEIRKEIRDVSKMVGELTDGWGKFVEGLVSPSIPKIFERLGIDIFDLSLRRKRKMDGREMEIDILSIGREKDGEEIVILSEVKSNLKVQDVDEFTGILKEFKDFFPEFKEKKVIGVVTGIRFGEGIERYAEREGLYLLIPSGELMELGNSPNFKPKIWGKDE